MSLATPSPFISYSSSLPSNILPEFNFAPSPESFNQPGMAASLGLNTPSEISTPELGLIFPQEDPQVYLQVQVGAFEHQAPAFQDYAHLMIPGPPAPGITGNETSAEGFTENRCVLGQNFPESPGPPAALPLTALSLMSPLRGFWCRAPVKEISQRPLLNDPAPPEFPLGFGSRNTTWVLNMRQE